jgi:hypothetical protein
MREFLSAVWSPGHDLFNQIRGSTWPILEFQVLTDFDRTAHVRRLF